MEGIPAHEGHAWLRPIIRAEICGELLPADATTGHRVSALFREPPPSAEEIGEILRELPGEVPHPFLRRRLLARAESLLPAGAPALEPGPPAAQLSKAVAARVVVVSSYFLVLLAAGLVLLLRAALQKRDSVPLPPIRPSDGWGIFATWLGMHLFAMSLAASLPVSHRLRLPLAASLYLAVGAAALLLGGTLVARPMGISLRALLGVRGGLAAVAAGIGGLAAAVPLVTAAYLVASLLGVKGATQSSMLDLLVGGDGLARLGVVVLVGVGAPMVEEGIFRGILLPAMLTRMPGAAAVVLNALLFGIAHFDPPVLLPLCALGGVLSWLRLRTGSLLPGMVTHGLWNLQTVLVVSLLFGPVHAG